MKMRYYNLLLIVLLLFSYRAHSQDSVNHKRLKPLLISSAVIYTGTMVALSQTWYQDHEKSSFHFFNDNAQWKQVDKVGHFYTAYQLSAISYKGLRWTGIRKKQAALWGTAAGLIMILPVEWLDGYSAKYGASTADIIADVAGSTFFLAQQRVWGESRIIPKFSFHRTSYAPLRPDVLGDGLNEEWIKDYNGQTYWLSFDTNKFIPTEKKWVKFINVAVGYGANGMIYANDQQNVDAGLRNYRQYYLALDFDFTAIETNNRWIKSLIYLLNTIHFPAPTVSFGENKWNFHMFYF